MIKSGIIFFIISLIFTINSNSQDFKFPTNKEGEIEFLGNIESSYNKEDLFDKIKVWAISNKQTIALENTEKGNIIISGDIQGKSSYNIFAGAFNETVQFILTLDVLDNQVSYIISDFKITETYQGYGTKTSTISMTERKLALETAQKEKQNAEQNDELKRKKKKEIIENCNGKIERYSSSLSEAYKSLQSFLEVMNSTLK